MRFLSFFVPIVGQSVLSVVTTGHLSYLSISWTWTMKILPLHKFFIIVRNLIYIWSNSQIILNNPVSVVKWSLPQDYQWKMTYSSVYFLDKATVWLLKTSEYKSFKHFWVYYLFNTHSLFFAFDCWTLGRRHKSEWIHRVD